MPTIEVDDDVFRYLEQRVKGFGDTPNKVLRRELEISASVQARSLPVPTEVLESGPSKGRKTSLAELVAAGRLSEGQTLYLHDFSGKRVPSVEAQISGDKLSLGGRTESMSRLAQVELMRIGYTSKTYRGPDFWRTKDGKSSVRDLWDAHLSAGN